MTAEIIPINKNDRRAMMAVKVDYTDLDEMIKARITGGKNTFILIGGGEVYTEAKRLSKTTSGEASRIIDRRLQAMRKRGEIKYTTKEKWTLS